MSDCLYPPTKVDGSMINKKLVGVRLLSLPNTKNASLVPCPIELTFILKFHVWIMKSQAVTDWGD
jgi:hypothetical protein